MVFNGPLMGFNGAQWFSVVFDGIYNGIEGVEFMGY
jgi:hypothetical protein